MGKKVPLKFCKLQFVYLDNFTSSSWKNYSSCKIASFGLSMFTKKKKVGWGGDLLDANSV